MAPFGKQKKRAMVKAEDLTGIWFVDSLTRYAGGPAVVEKIYDTLLPLRHTLQDADGVMQIKRLIDNIQHELVTANRRLKKVEVNIDVYGAHDDIAAICIGQHVKVILEKVVDYHW